MLKYIVKRIIISIFLLLGVSVILYVLLRCMPTDFVENRILNLVQNGSEVSEEFIRQMYRTYGLDGNIFVGYFTWLGNVFSGDFGSSFISQRPVLSEIFSADRIGTSFFVAAVATVFEFLIAIPLGISLSSSGRCSKTSSPTNSAGFPFRA